ncbi:CvpA family protein [candidate division WOR-3 bacterium]|nr:CvpA family protein [candidate division WOR-3 bacterium]
MNAIDITILGACALAILAGAVLGIVRLVFYLLGLMVGAVAASYADTSVNFSPWLSHVLSLSLWIAVSFSFGAIGFFLHKKLKNIGINPLDRFWGAAFSTIAVSIALIVALSFVKSIYPPAVEIIEDSFAANFLLSIQKSVFTSLNR